MLGPSAGTLRCFRSEQGRRLATDLVFNMVSGDLLDAEVLGAGAQGAAGALMVPGALSIINNFGTRTPVLDIPFWLFASPMLVGFAAETGDESGTVMEHARAKLARKGCDLLVVNDVSGGAVFGSPDNEAVILSASGEPVEVPHGSKATVAHAIWDQVAARFRE